MAGLVFASGFCALVYQVGWQREFRLVFGASTAASAAVLAVFMGGLGLGGRLLGAAADRRPNPLLFYAVLEAGVAATAALTPWLLQLVRSAYLALGGSVALGDGGGTLLRLAFAALVLLPPTLLAGGTLSAAARAVEHAGDPRRRATGALYGLNTLGALAGCLAATFWLLESLGTRRTLWAAALLNAVVAAVAMAVARRRARVVAPSPVLRAARRSSVAAAPPRFVLAAAAVTGFAFFLMELVWYRMLSPLLGGTVYTFGLVLATALLGISVGGLSYPRLVARFPVGLPLFAATALAEAAAVALPFVLGDELALAALAWRPAAGSALAAYLPGWSLVTAAVVGPAAIVAGLQFPLIVALLGEGRDDVGRHVGLAYLWNTAGAIAGSLAGGFGLLPLLGATGAWWAVVLSLGALGVAAAVVHGGPRRRLVVAAVALGAVAGSMALALGPTAAWRHSGIGAGRASAPDGGRNAWRAWLNEERRTLVWEREGVESSVGLEAVAGWSFLLNGKVDGNARNDAPTQVMGGLLGALLRPGPQRSLVIGLGTGSTAGWLARLPGMERVDVMELEPAVLEVARLCAPVNEDALRNPAVVVSLGDARERLMAGRERWDLVFSEPSNPYRAGVASLFTREYYEAVAARLSDDGVFLQWVQAYDVDEATMHTVLATLGSVFPSVEVWQVHRVDLVLAASRQPIRHDAAALRARLSSEPFGAALRHAWRATALEDVLARFVAGPALARDLVARGQPVNTDDRNPVEFAFARTLSRTGAFEVESLRRDAARLGADRPEIEGVVDWGSLPRRRLAVHTLAGTPPPDDAPWPGAAHGHYVRGALAEALAALRQEPGERARSGELPDGTIETAIFAEALADAGDPAAVAWIQAVKEVQPTEAEAHAARLALRMGNADLARDALVAAFVHYRTDPWPDQLVMTRALSLAEELAAARPDMAPVLYEALSHPFAVGAIEEPRRGSRLKVASLGLPLACRDALAPFEPWVLWREDVLQYRSDCYARTRDPRAGRARRELQDFRSAVP